MALTLVLLIYPVALLIAIILMTMGNALSVGSLAMGLPLVVLVAGVGYGVIRFLRSIDKTAGVDQAPNQP